MGPFGSDIKRECYVSEGIPYLNGSNVQGVKLGEDSFIYVPVEKAEKLKKSLAHRGDIIVTHRGTIGQIVFVPNNSKYKEYLISNSQFRVTLRKEIVDSEFLTYFFHSKRGQYILLSNASQVGVPALARPTSSFRKLKIVIPSLPTQRRIANILSSLDRKIELNNQINKQLEEMAQAIFKSWFIDFEPFKDGEFVDSELGRIPKGWKVGTLSEVASFISRGLSPKYNSDTDEWILGQTCVRNNIVSLKNARTHLPKSKTEKWIKQWDILINSTGIGSLGRVGVVYFDKDNVAFDSHLTVVRVDSLILRHYVGRNLLSRQLEIENMAVGSTGQTELPRDSVKEMKIILPDDKTLSKFNSIIVPLSLKLYSHLQQNRELATLRDTLLPKLMSGEINLEQYGNQ